MDHKLVIVSGASGSLGQAYLEHFRSQSGVACVEMRRSPSAIDEAAITGDLLDAKAVASGIEKLPLDNVSEIVFIHPVGKFKFEENGEPEIDLDGDGIDDEVYASNVATFQNIVRPLISRLKRSERPIPLTVCAFGSLTDPYNIKYWQSYSGAKNVLRQIMRDLAIKSHGTIRSVFFNVSTVDTYKERQLRPFADTKYWLSTTELVEKSLPHLRDAASWKEVRIYKSMPGFDTSYYSDPNKVREKWSREMGQDLE